MVKVFVNHFSNTFVNSRDDHQGVKEFESVFPEILRDEFTYSVDIHEIEYGIAKLKLNKASGIDGLMAEHIKYSHPALIVHLKLLFWLIMKFSFVPDDFGMGSIVPIIKDWHGDICSVDNYRPITISPVISKLFELFLLEKFSGYFELDDLQFGFRKGLGCSHALFLLRQTIDHFTSHGSNVYVTTLDASKAFDRVNHFKLFTILNKSKVPKVFIRIIIN